MPIHSRWRIPIDVCSLPAFIFGSPDAPLPDKIAFYDADRPETHHLTHEAFRSWSLRLAAGLKNAGLQTGDRVLLFSGNSLFYPVVFMGILMAGGVFTGANPGYVERELAYQLKDSGAKFLICADESLEIGAAAAKSISMSKDHVFRFDNNLLDGTGGPRLGIKNWNSLLESKETGREFRWYEPKDPKDTTCCLNYSSGTTGVPKGVMISHYAYVANTTQYAHLHTLDPESETLTKTSKWLCYLPMYHAMAQTIFIAGGPKRQIPIYIMKKFDFIQVLESIQKYRITTIALVPPIVVAFAKSPVVKKFDLSSVRSAGSGAAPLGAEISEEFQALWPSRSVKLTQGWGMTELTCSALGADPTQNPVPGSVGELNANCSAKIMNADGTKEVERGERGEIWVAGPNVMKGYWGNPQATHETLIDDQDGRWVRTGDIAYIDKNGNFFIVDRIKELIKVKGNQVAPAELESVLLDHPQVADACVVGVTIGGEEVPRAYIVLKPGQKGSNKEVQDWLAKRSGKLLRKILRERARQEVGDKGAKL